MDGGQRKGRYVLIAAMVVLIAIALWGALNQPGGPVREVKGVIESSRYLPQQTGPAKQVAAVRLPDGSLVQATVIKTIATKPGDTARLRVYQPVFVGAERYEVIAIGGSP